LSDMILYIIDLLGNYGIDQLNFYDNMDNAYIDVTKYLTDTELKCYYQGDDLVCRPDETCFAIY